MRERFDILVVDDEAVIVGAARKILEAEGLSVEEAPDAETALRKVASNSYGLVLCDLMLPGTTGLDLMVHVEHHQPKTPMVLITGYATLAHAVDAFRVGVFDFIPKPFDFAELTGVVQRALRFAGSDPSEQRPIDLDTLADTAASGVSEEAQLFALGGHAWVALERDGTATVGMGETFAGLEEEAVDAEFPDVGEDTLQGNRCVRFCGSRNAAHRVWAPLSGRVVENNEDALVDANSTRWSALCRRWLIRILPNNLESELPNLIRR